MIYCFGNSHVNFFTDDHPETNNRWTCDSAGIFTSYCIGPVIAYNFTKNHLPKVLQILSSNKNFNFDEDYVMIVIGEVDCRWHLPKQINDQNRQMEEVVEECVNRFFESFFILREKGYKFIGWGGHPSTTAGHSNNMDSPVFGDCKSRNKISSHFKNIYKQKCLENNIPFISILEDLIDDDGLTRMDFFRDYCHLKTDLLIEKVIEKVNVEGLT